MGLVCRVRARPLRATDSDSHVAGRQTEWAGPGLGDAGLWCNYNYNHDGYRNYNVEGLVENQPWFS